MTLSNTKPKSFEIGSAHYLYFERHIESRLDWYRPLASRYRGAPTTSPLPELLGELEKPNLVLVQAVGISLRRRNRGVKRSMSEPKQSEKCIKLLACEQLCKGGKQWLQGIAVIAVSENSRCRWLWTVALISRPPRQHALLNSFMTRQWSGITACYQQLVEGCFV